MIPKNLAFIVSAVVIAGLFLTVAAPAPVSAREMIEQTSLSWDIANAEVLNGGETAQIKQGTLVTNYQIRATATASESGPFFKRGVFELTMTAFCPVRTMPGQKAGVWYTRGSWSIVERAVSDEAAEARHSDAVISGTISAELAFNPATMPGSVEGIIDLPASLNGGRWVKGQGTFQGNEKFEGTISVESEIWPDVVATVE